MINKFFGWFLLLFFFTLNAQTAEEIFQIVISKESLPSQKNLQQLPKSIQKELLTLLIQNLKEEVRAKIRCRSVAVLREISPVITPELRSLLVKQMQEQDPLLRIETAHTLWKLKIDPPETSQQLVVVLKNPLLIIRIRALEILSLLGEKASSVIPELLPLLQEREWTIRRMTAQVLGATKDIKAIPALIKALNTEKSSAVLIEIFHAFTSLKDKSQNTISTLTLFLEHPLFVIREAASQTLEQLTGQTFSTRMVNFVSQIENFSQLDALEKQKFLKQLEIAAIDGNWKVRFSAVEALGLLGFHRDLVVQVLTKGIHDNRESLRIKALQILGKIGSYQEVPLLRSHLKDSKREIRYTAAGALGAIGSEAIEALPVLREALKDSDEYVRMWAAWALGEIGSEKAIPFLEVLFEDRNLEVRQTAKKAVKKIRKD